MTTRRLIAGLAILLMLGIAPLASASVIFFRGGGATFDMDTVVLTNETSLTIGRYFNSTNSLFRSQILSESLYPSNFPSGLNLKAPIINSTPNSYRGSRQGTDFRFDLAGFDPANPFASWSPSTSSGLAVSGGEQIGLDAVFRYTSPAGALYAGDFALRYDPTRSESFGSEFSGLVLVSHFDFPVSAFDIGDALVSATSDSLTITGDLLISPEFSERFLGGAASGLDVGQFKLTVWVPETSPLTLTAAVLACFCGFRIIRSRLSNAGHAQVAVSPLTHSGEQAG